MCMPGCAQARKEVAKGYGYEDQGANSDSSDGEIRVSGCARFPSPCSYCYPTGYYPTARQQKWQDQDSGVCCQ